MNGTRQAPAELNTVAASSPDLESTAPGFTALPFTALESTALESTALESTVAALADSMDQVVFLQQAVGRAVHARGLPDLLTLLQDALTLLGAESCALNVGGQWVGEVPLWLAAQSAPTRLSFTVSPGQPDAPPCFLGVPFGASWLAFWKQSGTFSTGDARLAQTLADLIASTVEALRMRERQLQQDIEDHDRELAARIWRHLVPEQLDAPPHYRLASLSQPALQVGGDFQISLGNWIVVGDVSGKGISAALFTGMFVSSLRLAIAHDDMGAAIARALHSQLEAAGMLATLAAVYVEPNGTFRYFNMGHPPILIRRASGQIESLGATAPPLGTFVQDAYPVRLGRFDPGDLMCLYSDGMNEAQRVTATHEFEMFGLWKVRHTLAHAAATPEAALHDLNAALGGWDVVDDLTLVLLQYAPTPNPSSEANTVLELHLAADTSQLASLGGFVRGACQQMAEPGLPEVAVTELAVNAIVHGGATHMLVLVRALEDGYLVTFEDDGAPFNPAQQAELPAGELREGGYGLLIVRRSASDMHYRRRRDWNSTELTYLRGVSP